MNADMGVLDAAKGDLTDLMRRDRGEHARIPWGLSGLPGRSGRRDHQGAEG